MPLWIGETSGKPARGRAGHGAVTSPTAYAHGGALLALHTRATGEDTAVLSGALCQTIIRAQPCQRQSGLALPLAEPPVGCVVAELSCRRC